MSPFHATCFLGAIVLIASATIAADTSLIRPGEVWRDDRDVPIQAHGGGVVRVGDTYFWFGEDRSPDLPRGHRAVACYASKDLAHWEFRRRVVDVTTIEDVASRYWVLERPKVFHNAKTGKFVMYMHVDGPDPATGARGYALARVGVAVSDTVDGEYRVLRTFRPLGKESRDIGQFVDDDGSAYLIFECRPTGGFYVAALSEDYLDVAKEVAFVHAPLEGGAIVHYDGLYYALGSHLTGWNANPNVYATARRIEGPWSEFKDVAPPQTNTYESQSTFLLKVVGSHATSVIYLGDRWNPRHLDDSRYVWMPLEIGQGRMRLPEPRPWSIDVTTGRVAITPAP